MRAILGSVALEVLRGLGAVSGTRITAMGASMQRLPLHPRLARILLAADGAGEAALACAVLSERHYASAASHRTSNDLQTIVDNRAALPAHITRVARQLSSLVVGAAGIAMSRVSPAFPLESDAGIMR